MTLALAVAGLVLVLQDRDLRTLGRTEDLGGHRRLGQLVGVRRHVGTVDEQIGRYRQWAEAGVQEAIVALRLDGTTDQVEAFAPVIASFRR